MSRYILTSGVQEMDGTNQIFHLLPVEGLTDKIETVELPKELVPNITNGKNHKKFEKLLMKLSKVEVGRTKDGLLKVENKVKNIKFDDFVVDCCNGVFKDDYESIYCLLRNHGITF